MPGFAELIPMMPTSTTTHFSYKFSPPRIIAGGTKAVAFGWGMLLWAFVFSSTTMTTTMTTLAQDTETKTLTTAALPLTSSVLFEQYDNGSLYTTHFEAPYSQYPCQPRKIHLSPSSDVDPVSSLYNATVSFTLDLRDSKCMAASAATVRSDNADLVRVCTSVTYGRGKITEGSVLIYYDEGDYTYLENNRKRITEKYTLLRFDYTSQSTGKYYKSDLIHHVFLKGLEAGRQRYWYNIKVELLEGLEGLGLPPAEESHAKQVRPFFPPLMPISISTPPMPPLDTWYASQHPMTSPRFFLRGSYSKNEYWKRDGMASAFASASSSSSSSSLLDHSQSQTMRRERNQEVAAVLLGETPSYEFTTPPLYGKPTSIALVGDLGQTKNSTRTMARILDAARAISYETNANTNGDENESNNSNRNSDSEDRLVTSLFIAGDLSYSDGDPDRWESWLDLAEPLLREVPFVSVPGNHEIECDNTTHDVFVPYESFFRNPNRIREAIEVPPSQDYIDTMWQHLCTTPSEFLGRYDYGNAYYSYKHGLVHTIFLNSYTSLLDGSNQREWLIDTALPSVDRNLTPWLLVVFHTPLYTTFTSHYGELNPTLMKASGLREVFERYEVNLVVSGHDHAYLRTKPLDAKGGVAEHGNATIFWTLGAGGNREGHSTYRNPNEAEDWVAKRDNDEFGFGLFFAPNRTHAHLQWMRDDDNNNYRDDDDDSTTSKTSTPGNTSLVVRDSLWIENYFV